MNWIADNQPLSLQGRTGGPIKVNVRGGSQEDRILTSDRSRTSFIYRQYIHILFTYLHQHFQWAQIFYFITRPHGNHVSPPLLWLTELIPIRSVTDPTAKKLDQSDHFGPLSFFLTTMDMDQDMTDLSESPSPPQIIADTSSTINKVIEDWVIKMRAALIMLPPSDDKLLRLRFAEGLASEYVHIFA